MQCQLCISIVIKNHVISYLADSGVACLLISTSMFAWVSSLTIPRSTLNVSLILANGSWFGCPVQRNTEKVLHRTCLSGIQLPLYRRLNWWSAKIISMEMYSHGWSNVTQHEIHTDKWRHILIPSRRVLIHNEEELKYLFVDMLDKVFVKLSTSPGHRPSFMSRKRIDHWGRVNYQNLNVIIGRDSFPLLRVYTTLNSLEESSVFMTLDLASDC